MNSAGDKVGPFYGPIDEKVKDPVILLWTHRMSNRIGYRQQCPNSACVITENRNWLNNSLTKVRATILRRTGRIEQDTNTVFIYYRPSTSMELCSN